MKKVSLKKNQSSIQVMKTLQLLMEGDYTMQELIDKLNAKEEDAIFNNSVISKYINTCRYLGFDIPKIHNKYYVAGLPFGMSFSETDTELIIRLYNLVKDEMSSKCFKIFDGLIKKLNRYANKKIVRVDKDTYQLSYEVFEQAVRRKRKINLLFKNRAKVECIPLDIVETENKRERLIDINRLSGVEMLSDGYKYPYKNEQIVVTYALKNKLAQRYELRENEKLLSFNDGVKVISNVGENPEELFSRLLRYDTDCEILKPVSYRDNMRRLIEDALANYGISE